MTDSQNYSLEQIFLNLKKKGVSKGAVAEKIGITPSYLSKLINGDKPVSENFIEGFSKEFGEFLSVKDLQYLKGLKGQKNSLKDQFNASSIGQDQTVLGGYNYYETEGDGRFIELSDGELAMFIPLVEPYAQAGYLSGYADKDFLEELPKYAITVSRQHRGNYLAFRVTGDSMTDGSLNSIPDKSVVVGREIKRDLWRSRFHLHKYQDYIIVHKEGIIVKSVIEHDTEAGTITIRSLNPDKARYPDETLRLDDCLQILNVVHVGVSRSTF